MDLISQRSMSFNAEWTIFGTVFDVDDLLTMIPDEEVSSVFRFDGWFIAGRTSPSFWYFGQESLTDIKKTSRSGFCEFGSRFWFCYFRTFSALAIIITVCPPVRLSNIGSSTTVRYVMS